jgi:hypothetical protein
MCLFVFRKEEKKVVKEQEKEAENWQGLIQAMNLLRIPI